MKYTSIFEKIGSLISIANTSWINLAFLGIIIFLSILCHKNKISKKTFFLLSIIANTILILSIIYLNMSSLTKLGNSLMDDLFKNIYFPSTYFYLFIYLLMNITIIGSLINIHTTPIYQTVHGTFFLIQNFIFALILELLTTTKVDIFKKISLFSNKNLIILLELSVIVFVFWLLTLAIIYLSNTLGDRIILKKEQKELSSNEKPILEYENTPKKEEINNSQEQEKAVSSNKEIQEEPVYAYHFIPTMPRKIPQEDEAMINFSKASYQEKQPTIQTNFNVERTSTFDLSSFIPKETEKQIITPNTNNSFFDQIINNTLPYIQEEKKVTSEKDTYTLNDYRIFNKMLKDIKEHNQSNSLHIDKDLEYRLITKYSSKNYNLFKRMLKNYSN